jgi:hypothetical protein
MGSSVITGDGKELGDGCRGVGVEVVAVGPPAHDVRERIAKNAIPSFLPMVLITNTPQTRSISL